MERMSLLTRILEVLVTIIILLPLIFSIICFASFCFMPDKYNILLQIYDSPYITALGILSCIVLTLWLIVGGGINSRLWIWLPPFLFFRKFGIHIRTIIVILFIAVTLIGLFSRS